MDQTFSTQVLRYTVLFEPASEGGYVVRVPALPEVCTEGETRAEAETMARDAIVLALESRRAHGEAIPTDVSQRVETAVLDIPFA